ncbi:hypothetical protein EVAR_69054_1 [Eumeta japonica]|uniref:Uncharacterized protein n=1 Tax=Eumeta variegata TaxID=151549 RepID=A0A4C1ZHE9_EUMVA|nr:hypothetical protein EVAR_69054_1 [Eumeta japonica]
MVFIVSRGLRSAAPDVPDRQQMAFARFSCRDIVTETCQVTTSLPMKDVCHSSSSPRAYRAHLRITAGGDGVLYAVHGVTSQISAVVNSVPIHLYGVTGAVCLLEVGPETTTAPATCSVTSRGLRRGAWCRRYGKHCAFIPSVLPNEETEPYRITRVENREYVCVMEDSGKGSRQATRDALLVAGGYSKCKYFNSVYLFGMKMNRWSEGPSVSQFRPMQAPPCRYESLVSFLVTCSKLVACSYS